MTSAEFESVYTKVRPAAVRLAREICGASAEDAVQNAAIYFFERLAGYDRITPSLFLQVVSQRARHISRPETGWNKYLEPVGLEDELALLEKEQMPECGRRNPPAPRAE